MVRKPRSAHFLERWNFAGQVCDAGISLIFGVDSPASSFTQIHNMQPARITELLRPFLPTSSIRQLTERDLASISTYIDILRKWNARINLTAIRDEDEILTRHFGESLFAAAHLFPERKCNKNPVPTLADVGSGAGFPGIPIKLWARDISLTLIESNHKKATFLREVIRSITLTDVNIKNDRAEEVQAEFDFVTLRAVEQFENVLPVANTLLARSGRLVLLISSAQVPKALSTLQLEWRPPVPVPGSASRVLLIGDAVQRQ
jgi:16S rRNA (guanine527-N7)-methyltransferase